MSPALPLVLGTLVLSLAPIFVRESPVGPTATGAYRCLMAAPVLAAILLAQRRRVIPKIAFRGWWPLVAAGTAFAVDLSLWHRAIQYSGPGLATVIANTQVFFTAALGVLFFSERADRRFWLSIVGAFIGMALLVWRGEDVFSSAFKDLTQGADRYWWGVALGLCAAAMYALFIVFLRRAGSGARGGTATQRLFVVTAVSGLLMAGAAALEGDLGWPGAVKLGPLLGLALLPQVAGWLMITAYLPRVPVGVAGLILLLQPVLSVLLSRWLFNEVFQAHQIAGAALTLAAVYAGSTRASVR
ncbi:MAG: DMT family transporter [Bdellovibrionales bacterium]|nr:DMT family transporter [Bdellovibrionales bacterium]